MSDSEEVSVEMNSISFDAQGRVVIDDPVLAERLGGIGDSSTRMAKVNIGCPSVNNRC